jgi:hypothetical protein
MSIERSRRPLAQGWRSARPLANGSTRPRRLPLSRQTSRTFIEPAIDLHLKLIGADQLEQGTGENLGHHDQQLTCTIVIDQRVERFEITTR